MFRRLLADVATIHYYVFALSCAIYAAAICLFATLLCALMLPYTYARRLLLPSPISYDCRYAAVDARVLCGAYAAFMPQAKAIRYMRYARYARAAQRSMLRYASVLPRAHARCAARALLRCASAPP